jgi:hypothetical protein
VRRNVSIARAFGSTPEVVSAAARANELGKPWAWAAVFAAAIISPPPLANLVPSIFFVF